MKKEKDEGQRNEALDKLGNKVLYALEKIELYDVVVDVSCSCLGHLMS